MTIEEMLARKAHPNPNFVGSPSDVRMRFPCAPAQQRFWFEEALHPGNPGLNIAVRWRLEGPVSTSDLRHAWQALVARHAALRTFFAVTDGEAVQVVEPHVTISIPVVDLSALSEGEALAEADRLAEIEARRPFDLTTAPLLRVTRLQLAERVSILLVTAHHTICDGWSVGVLAREMGELCAALHGGRSPAMPPLALSYGHYAVMQQDWLASAAFEGETEYLRGLLAGYKQFELMPDRPRPHVQSANGKIVSVLLGRDVTNGLAGIARDNGCTLFVAALTALYTLLHHYSGETDIAVGTQVVGRDEAEFEDLVGCFVNSLALRGDLSGDPSFLELLERTRDTVMETLETRNVPLEHLIQIVKPKRDLSRNALFSVNFIFQRSFIKNANYGSFALVDLPSRSAGALYDLNFFMVERPEGWRASCEYNTDLFEGATVIALLEHFEILLRGVVTDPTQNISTMPLLRADDLRELVVESNRTEAPYPADRTLSQLFEAQAAARPGAIALTCGNASLTYAELDAAANRLARELHARGVAPGTRIGVFLERSPDLVIALLAILKAGSAYVPLDPAYPPERIAFIEKNSRFSALITRSSLGDRFTRGGAELVLVDTDAASIRSRDSSSLDAKPAPHEIAYVIYTSGSTGTPKGVQIQHRALVNFLWAMRDRPGLGPDDTLVAVTTVSFDIAGLELYLPLVVGAKLVMATAEEAADGRALLQRVRQSGATVLQATPVTWQLLLEAGWRGDPRLKMLCGGEAVSRDLATRLLDCGDDLWNMYGPTETTIWSSVARIERGDGPVLLGAPIANTQFYVLDKNGRLAPPGVPGELYIGGDGVALGYLDLPIITRDRFVPDTFRNVPGARLYRTGDIVRTRGRGRMEFLGRTDSQIKLRGFRIELGEVESHLMRQSDVADAVAIVGEDAFGEKTLWAFVVPCNEMPSHVEAWTVQLRARLSQFLPNYMLPSPIVALPALPRTPNGKIDRRLLPTPAFREVENPQAARPRSTSESTLESTLESLIAALLGREHVGREEDIFGIGFHSLLAVRLVARIRVSFDVEIPLRDLFEHPTVAALAQLIDVARGAPGLQRPAGAIVTLNSQGERQPFFYLHSDLFAGGLYCRRLAASVGPQQPFHAVAPHGTAGLPNLPSIEAMARDYLPRLRAVQAHGPYRVGGFCVSGLIAYELARLLRADGEVVEDVVMINASALPTVALPPFDWLVRKVGLDARLGTRFRESFCYNVARLHGALIDGPPGIGRFLKTSFVRLLSRDRRLGRQARAEEPQPFEKRRGRRETENFFAHLVAALTYHPKFYDGHVTLIWGIDQDPTTPDPRIAWGKLAGSVKLAPIAGGHVAALHENIEEFARELDAILCE